ncbi:MAG TPA: ammonium transporter [Chthoniobacteraceae bacterium]|jgi:Amt family ammonium transporter|nr:ammonium transporter [Chthoniobacteraceae bacterium]
MKRLLHVTWCAVAILGLTVGTLRAQEKPADAAAPAAPVAADTTPAAPEPAAPKEGAPAATEAAKGDAPAKPEPTIEQRLAGLEAYIANGDPSAPLKDAKGNIPKDLTTVAASNSGPGHNAWMMTSAALVLFMTLPGLALFYGGLVRRKNVLSVCAQCLLLSGLVAILWWAFGYSLVFGKSYGSAYLGGSEFFFLKGVTSAPNSDYSFWVSQNVFSMYQLMFAIITPALIVGAIAERMKFSAILVFMTLWMFLVYFPMAHMIWGATGLMNGVWNADAAIPAIDFAGGTVVHMTSGWSALILCIIIGKRIGFGKDKMAPHNMVLCMVGTGMLWVGWYGFNAGSAVAADGIAANAFMTTTLAAATAGFVWAMLELIIKGHASILGFCSGIVAGLVVITPACGFVDATGAMIIGVLAGVVPFFAVVYLKGWIGYDDALDTFGVHAVGGTLGAILTGLLATGDANSNLLVDAVAGKNGLKAAVTGHTLVFAQLKAIVLTLVLSVVVTAILGYALKFTIGLRPTPEGETLGLDLTDHNEEGYIL